MRASVLLAFLAALTIAGAATAQRDTRQPFSADPFVVSADIVEATRLINVDPEAALAMLRKLNARYPGRDDILARLGYAMQVVGNVDSAAVYYRAALEANPVNLDAGKSLGSIYFAKGREKEAMQVFDQLLEANNYSIAAYKMVASAIRDLGRPDQAIAVLESGRQRSKKNGALTLEIATYYRQLGDNRRAFDQYFDYVAEEPRGYRFVRDRMIETIRDSGRDEESLIAYLKGRVDRGGTASVVAADVLAAHYLERGMLENSLEMALRADNDKVSDGSALLSLAEAASTLAQTKPRVQSGRYLDLALRSLEGYIRSHPKAPAMDRARFALAGVYVAYGSGANPAVPPIERAGYLERAADEYAAIAKSFPGSELAEQSYLERGDVLLYRLKRPDDALAVYQSGSINARKDAGLYAARIAEVYIGTGRGDEAQRYLTTMLRSAQPDRAQAAQYYVGVYLATQHKYDAARDTLTALAERAPSSAYTNDAIETAWVIEEGLKLGSESLDDLVAARKAEMVGDTATAVTRLEAIAAREARDPLRPRALNRLGLILFEQGNYDASLATLRRFLDDYPEHDQAPAVRRAIGRVYEVGLGQYAQALKEYEQVLMSYPQYAMLDDVRRDVTRMRAATEGTTYAP